MMRKSPIVLLLFCCAFPYLIKAQDAKCVVIGKIDSQLVRASYAFLYFPERKITVHTPITNSEFKFSIDKKVKFEMVMLYFGKDSTKTYNDIQSNRSFGIKELVFVALEDSVHIFVNNNDLNTVKITGGDLNRDLQEMNDTIKSGKYLDFFSTHPSSPVSILFLKTLTRIKDNPMFSQLIDCKLYYSKLSEDLRKSTEGLVIWDMISK